MKKALLLVSVLMMSVTAFAQRRGDFEWGGFSRYKEANEEMTSSPKVVFMGDSITEFWFSSDPDFFNDNNFVGRGIGGQCSTQMLCRFQSDVIALKPKVVVINAGTNDIAGNNGKILHKDVVAQIKSMCELARMHGITPVVTSVLPCDRFFWNKEAKPAQDIIALNKLIRKYALSAGLIYVDYHSEMSLSDGSLPAEYSEDGCHPLLAGYKKMEEIVLPYINKALAL